MAEPLFPFATFSELCDMGSTLGEDGNEPAVAERLREMLSSATKIPPQHLCLLKYLLQFLHAVTEEEESNKMGVSNVAKMIGPVIIRPRITGENDMLNAMRKSAQVNRVVQFLMEHESLFEKTE
jgi:RhoGAP domain